MYKNILFMNNEYIIFRQFLMVNVLSSIKLNQLIQSNNGTRFTSSIHK